MLGPTLRGTSISLEPARPEDAPLRQRWFAELEVTRLYSAPGMPSLKQEEESFERAARDESLFLWRIALDGESIGQAFLNEITWMHRQARTGMLIGDRNHWGKGYGSVRVTGGTRYCFTGWLQTDPRGNTH